MLLQIRKHPNLVSYIMFPLTANRTEFVAGERVEVLVGLENRNKASAVELKGIQASIRMPQQWDFHIQNVCHTFISSQRVPVRPCYILISHPRVPVRPCYSLLSHPLIRICPNYSLFSHPRFFEQFTGMAATEKIPAGAEAAIMYTFIPHESFDSRDYGLTVLIDYEMVCALRSDCFGRQGHERLT